MCTETYHSKIDNYKTRAVHQLGCLVTKNKITSSNVRFSIRIYMGKTTTTLQVDSRNTKVICPYGDRNIHCDWQSHPDSKAGIPNRFQ